MAKNNWNDKLDDIGKQLNQAEKHKADKPKRTAGCIELAFAALFLEQIAAEESLFIWPGLAGFLIGFAVANLKDSAPTVLGIGMAAEALVLVQACFAFVSRYYMDSGLLANMIEILIFELIVVGIPTFVGWCWKK